MRPHQVNNGNNGAIPLPFPNPAQIHPGVRPVMGQPPAQPFPGFIPAAQLLNRPIDPTAAQPINPPIDPAERAAARERLDRAMEMLVSFYDLHNY